VRALLLLLLLLLLFSEAVLLLCNMHDGYVLLLVAFEGT
jgi:hypothetical protein